MLEMAPQYFRCEKHGMVKHDIIHRCVLCAAEGSGTQPTANNNDLMQLLCRARSYILGSQFGFTKEEQQLIDDINAVLAQQH